MITKLSRAAEKKSVTVRGQEVWFREAGDGLPVLFLSGWGGASDPYFPLQNELAARGYRVVLPDLPGLLGGTAPKFIPADEWSSWIDGLGKAAMGPPFILVSHSLSGRIALQYLAGEHSNCRGAIFIGPWLFSSALQAIFWRGIASIARFLCPVIYPDMRWVMDRNAWATAMSLISATRAQPVVPCLVIWGKRDPARVLFSGWKRTGCRVARGSWGHSPQIESPRELAIIIDNFIRLSIK